MKEITESSNSFKTERESNKPLSHQEIRYQSAPLWSRALMLSIAGSVGFGLIYACIARIDEVVIARGELQAKGAERPIKAPISGLISKISVKEGDEVDAGELLIEFDTQIVTAREDGLLSKLQGLKNSYEVEKEIAQRLTALASEGAIPKLDYLRQKNRLEEIQSNIAQTQATIREVKYEKLKTKLLSPLKGRVFDLVPASAGYAASIGETLLKIVPKGDVEAKVFITNADIGFVKPQMEAQIRVDAYPFTQFGSITGELKAIGEEVLPANEQYPYSRFPAYLKLNQQYLEKNKTKYIVRPGQSISVNLRVRKKPVISLLTDSVEKAWDSLRGIKTDQT